MSALIFTLKTDVKLNLMHSLDCGRLTPNNLAGLSKSNMQNLSLLNIKNSPKAGDYFDISGEDIEHIIFRDPHQQLDNIGHKMSRGQITIEGNCGDFLGSQMRGGTIICHGTAKDRVGDQMRRGLILIDGDAGDYCGSRMIAGTIGVFGSLGNYAGFAMKRGTILLTQTPHLHATIQDCGMHKLPFLALLFKTFQTLPTRFNNIETLHAKRFAGDLVCNGNGEILILQ